MDEIDDKPTMSPEEIRKGIDALWKEVAARPPFPAFLSSPMEQHGRAPAHEAPEPSGPAQPPAAASPPKAPKPPERADIVALRSAAAALDAERHAIKQHVQWGYRAQDFSVACARGSAAMLPVMIAMRLLFL